MPVVIPHYAAIDTVTKTADGVGVLALQNLALTRNERVKLLWETLQNKNYVAKRNGAGVGGSPRTSESTHVFIRRRYHLKWHRRITAVNGRSTHQAPAAQLLAKLRVVRIGPRGAEKAALRIVSVVPAGVAMPALTHRHALPPPPLEDQRLGAPRVLGQPPSRLGQAVPTRMPASPAALPRQNCPRAAG